MFIGYPLIALCYNVGGMLASVRGRMASASGCRKPEIEFFLPGRDGNLVLARFMFRTRRKHWLRHPRRKKGKMAC